MSEPKFKNKNGTLTRYSFMCGYLEVYVKGEDRVVISKEPNDYHVKGFHNEKHIWEIFEKVKDARRFARKHGKLKK